MQREAIWRIFGSGDEVIRAAAGFVTPSEAAKVMAGNTGLIDHFPQTAPRSSGACGMNVPAGTKCKVCGKVHPL
jgi:hypothetical protein